MKRRRVTGGPRFRPVTIVNAGARKVLDLRVEVPVEDMAKLGEIQDIPSGPAIAGAEAHVDLAEHSSAVAGDCRERTSTLIFVNARRVAERLAGALNDLGGRADCAGASWIAGGGAAE